MSEDRDRTLEVFRCFCAKKPILAIIKAGPEGKPYVHIRVYKQTRIFTEIVFTFGEMKVCCRECFRWHKIRITNHRAVIERAPSGDLPDLVKGEI